MLCGFCCWKVGLLKVKLFIGGFYFKRGVVGCFFL